MNIITTDVPAKNGNQFIDIELDGFTVRLLTMPRWKREAQKKTRIYVDGEPDVDFTEAYAMQKANGYAPIGTNPAEDSLFRKLNREVVKNKRAVIEALLGQPTEMLDLLGGMKLSFSKYAGCSMCPCSPGFIAELPIKRIAETNQSITDIWITRKAS